MIESRIGHGLQKMAQKILAFGGFNSQGWSKRAEVYDIVQNMWTNLPDMPEECAVITCVRVKNQILISGYNFRLMSYNIDNEAYSYIG